MSNSNARRNLLKQGDAEITNARCSGPTLKRHFTKSFGLFPSSAAADSLS